MEPLQITLTLLVHVWKKEQSECDETELLYLLLKPSQFS